MPMICPFCGKLSPDSNTLCMYCGTAQIKNMPHFRDSGKYRNHPEEQPGRVYEIHDTTEFEWGDYVGYDREYTVPVDDPRRIPAGPHEWSPVSDSDAGEPSMDEHLTPPENDAALKPEYSQAEHEAQQHDEAPEVTRHDINAPQSGVAEDPVASQPPQSLQPPHQPNRVEQPPQAHHSQASAADHPAVSSPEAPAQQDGESVKSPPPSSPPPSSPSNSGATPTPQKKRVRLVSEVEMLNAVLAGHYDIIRTLGTGGMATVYLAHEVALDRDVAIKVLPQVFLRDKQFVSRFKREARLAAKLEHPHIVRIYHIGEEPRLCYFTMSYIPGGTVAQRVRNSGPLPAEDIVRWGIDVCSALGYAHERGVIHRDLKPDNIMLDYDGRAIVMDFGIAHAAEGTNLTRSGALIGTPQYMSPDQAMGRPLDARSDIYSLGMVLYKMCAGKLPFKSKDPLALMYMHVNKTPQPPDALNPSVPPWLRDIILACIAKRPEDRFGSAYELRDALNAKKPQARGVTLPSQQEAPTRSGSILKNAISGAFSGFKIRK